MRLQYEQSKVLQDFQNFALILSAAFGGKKDNTGDLIPPKEGAKPLTEDKFDKLRKGFKLSVLGEDKHGDE